MKKNKILFIVVLSFFAHSFLFAQTNAFKSGKKDGVWNYYGSNKVLLARHYYNVGVRTGIWEFYTIDGKLWWTYNFNNSTATYLIDNPAKGFYSYLGDDGQWIKKDPDAKTIWLSSESQWNNFLVNNLKMPEESVPARIPGKVEIRVTVDEQGNAIGYKVGNDIEAGLDKEALRVAKLYNPEFIPAQKNGKNVKSVYTLLVSYKLADSR